MQCRMALAFSDSQNSQARNPASALWKELGYRVLALDKAHILACSTMCFINLPRSSLTLIYLSNRRCGNAPLDHLPLNRITTMRKRFRSVSLSVVCSGAMLVDSLNAVS